MMGVRGVNGDGEIGLREAWKIFRGVVGGVRKGKEREVREVFVGGENGAEEGQEGEGCVKGWREEREARKRKEEEEDWRRAVVSIAEEVADLHERIKKCAFFILFCDGLVG